MVDKTKLCYQCVIGISLALSVSLLFVSCVLSHDWWNMFIILPLIFVPVSFVMFGVGNENAIALDGTNSVWKSFVEFLGGFFISCALAIAGVTYHWGRTNADSLATGLLSVLFFLVSGGAYLRYNSEDSGYMII